MFQLYWHYHTVQCNKMVGCFTVSIYWHREEELGTIFQGLSGTIRRRLCLTVDCFMVLCLNLKRGHLSEEKFECNQRDL
jgi:hypothetical protein